MTYIPNSIKNAVLFDRFLELKYRNLILSNRSTLSISATQGRKSTKGANLRKRNGQSDI